ncbi:MAG: peptide/nickel transport system substrate-binding protein [Chloroflexota bacterium]|nr:peptide/nickel transport system substrate-binding protein [Chloroflexota bacterium]
MRVVRARASGIVLGAILLVAACAPQRTEAPAASAPVAPAPAPPKILTIVQLREPGTFEGYTGVGGGLGGVEAEANLAMNHLVVSDNPGEFRPQLATELPSVEKGTWRVNADGSMDVTWKIQSNAVWHDGTPFTSADLAFAWRVNRDPDLPTALQSIVTLMDNVTAPDATTLQAHWSRVYVNALNADGLTPLPRHILEDLYNRDKQAFSQSAFFTTEYVGLGPYRLSSWTPGAQMEFVRFDKYFLGRPPLDKVVVRYIGDSNTSIANIMAGQVDVVLPTAVQWEGALTVRRQWEGTKNQVLIAPQDTAEVLMPQYRPEAAQPKQFGPAQDRTVRAALYHALDRQSIADTVTGGLSPLADSWISPQDMLRRDVESAIPQYPYDPARAQQLLAQVGWNRGGDGILVHSQTGERFELPVWSRPATGGEQELLLITENFKQLGIDASVNVITGAQSSDRTFEATRPGVSLTKPGASMWPGPRAHSKEIASEANRWTGQNKFAYSNPRFDALVDRFLATIDGRERVQLERQLVQEGLGDVMNMPIFWYVRTTLALENVKLGNGFMTSMFEWNKQ